MERIVLEQVSGYVENNSLDLQTLGLLFARLLLADQQVLSTVPSPVLAMVMGLDQEKILGTEKPITELLRELAATGIPPLSDGSGGSVLRL